MASTEERLRILRMIEQGKISAADGAELLRAVEQSSQIKKIVQATKTAENTKPRWLHVQVTDEATGKKKVNINVPLGLVNIGLKMGARFAPQMTGDQYDKFITTIKHAAKREEPGKIFETVDSTGNFIEVFVE